jgi:hypothetical protein
MDIIFEINEIQKALSPNNHDDHSGKEYPLPVWLRRHFLEKESYIWIGVEIGTLNC